MRPHFRVFTRAENDTIAANTVVLRYQGVVEPPMASDLKAIWAGLSGRYERVLFDLDSPGGSLTETRKVIAEIRTIREQARVDTLVRHGAMCASACIAIFVQGEARTAGGASVWLFHGACRAQTNVPALDLTSEFLDLLRDAGVSESFLCYLVDKEYVLAPGKLWLSGYELFHIHDANIITRLLEPWRSEPPQAPPSGSGIGPR